MAPPSHEARASRPRSVTLINPSAKRRGGTPCGLGAGPSSGLVAEKKLPRTRGCGDVSAAEGGGPLLSSSDTFGSCTHASSGGTGKVSGLSGKLEKRVDSSSSPTEAAAAATAASCCGSVATAAAMYAPNVATCVAASGHR